MYFSHIRFLTLKEEEKKNALVTDFIFGKKWLYFKISNYFNA